MQKLNQKHILATMLLLFALPALAIDVNFNVPLNVTDYPGKDLSVFCTAGPQTTGLKSTTVKVPLVNGTFYGNVKVTVKGLEPKDVQPGVGRYACNFIIGDGLGILTQMDGSKPSKMQVGDYF